MARLRKAAGYTQTELAKVLGVTQRVITYYETKAKYPPSHLLTAIAKALSTSADTLLGLDTPENDGPRKDTRLRRRISKLEKLPPAKRRKIVDLMDAFLEEM